MTELSKEQVELCREMLSEHAAYMQKWGEKLGIDAAVFVSMKADIIVLLGAGRTWEQIADAFAHALHEAVELSELY